VFVATPDLLDKMCLGAVAGSMKFCTLDETSCTFSTHAKKVAVCAGSIYISTGHQSAFAHHYAPTVSLSSKQLEGLLEERHTKEEWIRLLLGLRQGSDGVDAGSSPGATNPVSVLNGVTPGRKRKVRYEDELRLGTQTPSRGGLDVSLKDSFDSEGELVILTLEDLSGFEAEDKVAAMWGQWSQVISMLQCLGGNLRGLKALVAEDFLELDSKVLEVEAKVGGLPTSPDFEDCGTLGDGLELVHSQIKDLATELQTLLGKSSLLTTAVETRARESQLVLQQRLETALEQGFKEVENAMKTIVDAVKCLNQEQEFLREMIIRLQQQGRVSLGMNSQQYLEVTALVARVKLLEARLPAQPGGRLGDETFRSRVDVLAFVETHVPSNCFFLFHDVVTFMEALTTSHVERKDVLEEWYRSTKVGVNEASACHMASFQLILPTVFGRVKEGSAASVKHHLPAVRSFKEWNTFDGVSGVKSFIAAGMDDLKYQFRQDIDRTLDLETHTKARLLAAEMLKSSQTFVVEMSSWVDAFYQELISTSDATEDKA